VTDASPAAEERQPARAGVDGLHDVFVLERLTAPTVVAALAEWRQGDLVEGVRLFWAGPSGLDPLSGLDYEQPPDGGWVVARWEQPNDGPNTAPIGAGPATPGLLGIVTSQTCDVGATGPGARHPTVQVSPLVRLDQLRPDRANEVRAGRTVDMMLVPNAPAVGEWVADLRISLPVSKSVLVAQTPVRGFVTTEQACEFAERLALKSRRPAVHDAISGFLADGLNQFVRRQRNADAGWVDRVEQFRVRAKSGDLLNPVVLELIVITLDGPLSAEETAALRQWRYEQRSQFKTKAGGALLTSPRFLTLERMKVQDYRESVPLRVPELGQGAFW
jgi:hypothetical protein